MPRRKPHHAPDATPPEPFTTQLEAAKSASTLQLLFKAARLLDEQALARAARESGRPPLRRAHTSLLPHVDLGGTRITDLAQRLGVSKQATSQLVDDLEALGVMARMPDEQDARARRVVFTEQGRRDLMQGLALLQRMERELGQAIGEAHMTGLRQALLAILATLAAGESAVSPPQGEPAATRPRRSAGQRSSKAKKTVR
jgi:DNA-binding MarR family transcriptional regulator